MRAYILNHNLALAHDDGREPLAAALSDMNFNSGNAVITEGLRRHVNFDPAEDGVANIFAAPAESLPYRHINSEFTHVIISFQDQLGPNLGAANWRALIEIISRIEIPIVAIGLGSHGRIDCSNADVVDAMTCGAVAFWRLLGKKCSSIGVRGAYTAETLSMLGVRNVEIVGCPSYYASGPGRRLAKPPLPEMPRLLAGGLLSNGGSQPTTFIAQSERILLHSLYGAVVENGVSLTNDLQLDHAGYLPTVADALFHDRVHFFVSPFEWREFLIDGGFHLCAGTRVHGAICAMNAGIPALITAGDVRAREMCELFGIPFAPGLLCLDLSMQDIYDRIDLDAANARYDELFKSFTGWLSRQGLEPMFDGNGSAQRAWRFAALPTVSRPERLRMFMSAVAGE